jgi:RNase H-fold protein (predicted Holliday junction resolvase)
MEKNEIQNLTFDQLEQLLSQGKAKVIVVEENGSPTTMTTSGIESRQRQWKKLHEFEKEMNRSYDTSVSVPKSVKGNDFYTYHYWVL